MAINPLFSGPGHPNKVLPGARPGNRSHSTMTYPAPCKKPRINGDRFQMEKDPFQDFEESFTADDLEKIDYIESQALSQLPKDHSVQGNTGTSSKVNGTRKTFNEESHGAISSSGYDSMTQGSTCQRSNFSFKPLASRSPNVPSKSGTAVPVKFPGRQSTSVNQLNQRGHSGRQTNPGTASVSVNYASSKMYVGHQPSQGGSKSSPPIASSQNRYKKAGESQPNSKGIRLQQSNVSVPLHGPEQPHSQGFSVSEAALRHDTTGHASARQTTRHAAPVPEVRFNLTAQTVQQGGASKTLTPPTGCTSSGSASLPSHSEAANAKLSSLMRQEQEKLKEELKRLKAERFSKDGEIQVLRQNLGKTKTEVSRLKMEKLEQEERWRKEQNERDKELAKEAESLKTQLQFKERELAEAQSSFRNLEQRLQTTNSGGGSVARNPITPPRSSPRRFAGASLPKRGADLPSPKHEGGFPTRESFMESNPALGSPSRVKMRLVEEGRGSPRSPKRVASRSPARSPKVAFTVRRKMEKVRAASRRDHPASSSLTLPSRYPKGQVSPAQLIGRLIEQPQPQSYQPNQPTQGSLIVTLQAACDNLDPSPALRDEGENKVCSAFKRQENSPPDERLSAKRKNYAFAMRAISSLLNSTSPIGANNEEEEHPRNPMDDSAGPARPPSGTEHSTAILGVLPLLEDQLTEYIDAVHALSVCVGSSAGSTCPSGGTARSLDSSLEGGAQEEQLRVERVEAVALKALRTLRCLACDSPAVCGHVVRGGGGDSADVEEGEPSIMDIDPSAPLIDPTQAPRCSIALRPATSQQGSSSTPHQGQSGPELPHCHIMKRLVKIMGMQPPSEGQNADIVDTALRIILELARSVPLEDAFRFSDFVSSDALHAFLSPDSPHNTKCLVLSILASLSKCWHLTQKFCTQSDTCLLLQVYQCASHGTSKVDPAEKTRLALHVIELLTNITSIHYEGPAFLLDADCQCSEEVVSSLVIMLSREFSAFDQESGTESQRLAVVRRGLLPLHSLFMDGHFTDHRLEAEQQYNHLITEMNRLVTRLPHIHRHDVGFLQDFDGSDEDEYQDSQEAATQMDVN